MIGLAGNSIVIKCDEANEYIKSRLTVLHAEKDELLERLESVESQINTEMEKLFFVNNPPNKEECGCCNSPTDLKSIVGRLIV